MERTDNCQCVGLTAIYDAAGAWGPEPRKGRPDTHQARGPSARAPFDGRMPRDQGRHRLQQASQLTSCLLAVAASGDIKRGERSVNRIG